MKTIQLIEGNFAPNDARELTLDLIYQLTNYYRLVNLRSEVQAYKPDKTAWNTIVNLEEARQKVLTMLEENEVGNQQIKIELTIGTDQKVTIQPREILASTTAN